MASAVEIEGLREFRAALRRIDPALNKGVREGLKDAAQIVAYEARRRAPVRSGMLRSSIKGFASGNRAGVRVTARRISPSYPGGYPYPRRIEFEGGVAGTIRGVGGTTAGPRAFVAPALEAKREEVIRRLNFVIDDVAEIWAGRGGI